MATVVVIDTAAKATVVVIDTTTVAMVAAAIVVKELDCFLSS